MPNDHHHHDDDHRCPSCDYAPFSRNAYWTGKLMLARDFVDEQKYVVEKLRHHNQMLHGVGVVCGLKVVQHPKEACRDRFVCVEPGTAVDCCGHEIVVRERDCVDLWSIPEIKKLKNDELHTLRIGIKYRECESEPIPKLYDECGCDDDTCAPNRILESYAIHVLPGQPERPGEETKPEHCGDLWMDGLKRCPHCDQPDCLILATINDRPVGTPIVDAMIDNSTRTILPSVQLVKKVIDCILSNGPGGGTGPAGPGIDEVDLTIVPCSSKAVGEIVVGPGGKHVLHLDIPTNCGAKLTHICHINWEHAGTMNREDLKVLQLNRDVPILLVAFGGPIVPDDIKPHTFIVQRSDEDRKTQLTCWCEVAGSLDVLQLKDPCDLDKGIEPANTKPNLVIFQPEKTFERNKTYRVIVKGDLIRDGAGKGVDANHLPPWVSGKRFTGDGIEGGTFESWFDLR